MEGIDEKLILVVSTSDTGVANADTNVEDATYVVEGVVLDITEDDGSTVILTDDDLVITPTGYTYEILGQPANGTLTDVAGVISYEPDANFSGTDTFTYIKTNVVGQTVTAVATVNVTAVADAPSDSGGTDVDPITITISEAMLGDSVTPVVTDYVINGDFENGGSAVAGTFDETGIPGWTLTSNGNNEYDTSTLFCNF